MEFCGRPWPRGHNLKSLASKPASPRKCPVLGSRTALFFELLKMGQGNDQFRKGGVEDTRLETKDTKRIRDQGQGLASEDRPSRGQGQECWRPRTKDTAASALKKKGFRKSFSGDLQFIGVYSSVARRGGGGQAPPLV